MSKIRLFFALFALALFAACSGTTKEAVENLPPKAPDIFAFGYKLNDFEVVRDTVRKGDTFADIFLEKGFTYPQIYDINIRTKKKYNFKSIPFFKSEKVNTPCINIR